MSAGLEIAVLDAAAARAEAGARGALLTDCVAGGASVNLMAGYTAEQGAAFFEKVAGEIERGETALLAAVEVEARAYGRTLLVLDTVTGGDGYRLYARRLDHCRRHPGLRTVPGRKALRHDGVL